MIEQGRIREREGELGNQIVRMFRSWHRLEEANGTGVDVIDFDLAPIHLQSAWTPFFSRQDVMRTLGDMSGEIVTNTPAGEFLHAKTVASLAFLEALEGDKKPLDVYLEQTVGIHPTLIPESEIEEQYQRVNNIFLQFGNGNLDKEGWASFFETAQLSPEEIETTFIEAKDLLVPIVQDNVGQNFTLDYTLEFQTVDKPWINRISGDPTGFYFRVNRHPRNQQRWFRGVTEALAVHEMGGHLVQAMTWKKNIQTGLINPGYGVTAIPGPEQWNCEGMADTLAFLVPGLYEKLSPYGKFAVEYTYLKDMVYNNAHIFVNEPDTDITKTQAYVQSYIPSETDERASSILTLLQNDPRYRSYYYTYSSGGYHHRRFAEQ